MTRIRSGSDLTVDGLSQMGRGDISPEQRRRASLAVAQHAQAKGWTRDDLERVLRVLGLKTEESSTEGITG